MDPQRSRQQADQRSTGRCRGRSGRVGQPPLLVAAAVIDHREIVAGRLEAPPEKLGVTHWPSRLLARYLKIGDAAVARAWREYVIQPWRIGLYLVPPENALVLCVDELGRAGARLSPYERYVSTLQGLVPGLPRLRGGWPPGTGSG